MKTLGILGGMGSMATIDFFRKIVENTEVHSDQEHVHIIIDNYAQIPDRTGYIVANGEDPLPQMIEGAKRLETAGADFITIPCNTAHFFYEAIQSELKVPVLHMIDYTLKRLMKDHSKALLLATNGTYGSDIYKTIGSKYDMEITYPDQSIRDEVAKLIYDYKEKGTVDRSSKVKVLNYIKDLQAGCVILGCTELPLIFSDMDFADPTLIIAQEAIQLAGAQVKIKKAS